MTRVLLTSNESSELQLPLSVSSSYEGHVMASSSGQNVEITMSDSLGQMTSSTAVLSIPMSHSKSEQDSAMNSVQSHHSKHQNNGGTMAITLSNGNFGHLHQQQQHHVMMPSPLQQTHTFELHPNFVTTIIDEPEIRPHMCQICSATYKTRTHLRRHMFIHLTSRPYPCPDCGKGFNRKEHLNKHTEAVHSGTKYKCPYCGKEISRKDHLSRHIKNMHLATAVGSQQQLKNARDGESLSQSSTGKHTNKQSKLPRIFPSGLTITSLNQSQQSATTKFQNNANASNRYLENPLNADSQLSFNNSIHANVSADKKIHLSLFTCPECSATFTSERDLSIHSRVHKPQPYKCNQCTRAYTRREKLTEHVRCFHQGQKFSCEYCGKELSRKDHVLRHVRSVHPEVLATRFVAIAEGGSFDTSSNLSRSLNSSGPPNGSNGNNIPSMGEMGVLLRSVCHICLKVFGTSYHLGRHMESCHNGDVRPYGCNNCSKQFKRKDHLTKHAKSHCHQSGRDSSSSATLRSIIRSANGSNGDGTGNDGLEGATLSTLDAADLMQQDAIDSLQIEMMTDVDEDDESGDSDSNDEDEDSKELPGLVQIVEPKKNVTASIKKKAKTKPHISQENSDYALSVLKASFDETGAEGNENSLIHLQMETTENNLRIPSTFPCGHCQKEFNSRNKLLLHLQEHSSGDLKSIQSQQSQDNSMAEPTSDSAVSVPMTIANSEHISVTSLWN